MLTKVPIYVLSSTGDEIGVVVGSGRLCQLESCGGWCLPVRWPGGKLTWPCSKGMSEVQGSTDLGIWKINTNKPLIQAQNALKVLTMTPGIRAYLEEHDTKALSQAEEAIAAIDSCTNSSTSSQ